MGCPIEDSGEESGVPRGGESDQGCSANAARESHPIEWQPGRDSKGNIPLCGSPPKPCFRVSACGRYFIPRIKTPQGWASELWFKPGPDQREQLLVNVTAGRAERAAQEHLNGLRPEVA
jgi:hypothetical protein